MNTTLPQGFSELARIGLEQPDNFKAVRDLASNLITLINPSGPPFNPEEYAKRFGVHVVEAPCTSDGFLTTCEKLKGHLALFDSIFRIKERSSLEGLPEDAAVIVVRRQAEPVTTTLQQKRRFTIAHEFAHWYLRNVITNRIGPMEFRYDSDEEMLCDLFAAELLLPTTLLEQDLSCVEFRSSSLMTLADRYEVSLRTLLVKVTGMSRYYAAFALFSYESNLPEVCYTTPVRQRDVFFDAGIQSEVCLAFESERERRGRHWVKIKGRDTEVESEHVPLADGRRVLSYICTHPFQTKRLAAATSA